MAARTPEARSKVDEKNVLHKHDPNVKYDYFYTWYKVSPAGPGLGFRTTAIACVCDSGAGASRPPRAPGSCVGCICSSPAFKLRQKCRSRRRSGTRKPLAAAASQSSTWHRQPLSLAPVWQGGCVCSEVFLRGTDCRIPERGWHGAGHACFSVGASDSKLFIQGGAVSENRQTRGHLPMQGVPIAVPKGLEGQCPRLPGSRPPLSSRPLPAHRLAENTTRIFGSWKPRRRNGRAFTPTTRHLRARTIRSVDEVGPSCRGSPARAILSARPRRPAVACLQIVLVAPDPEATKERRQAVPRLVMFGGFNEVSRPAPCESTRGRA